MCDTLSINKNKNNNNNNNNSSNNSDENNNCNKNRQAKNLNFIFHNMKKTNIFIYYLFSYSLQDEYTLFDKDIEGFVKKMECKTSDSW